MSASASVSATKSAGAAASAAQEVDAGGGAAVDAAGAFLEAARVVALATPRVAAGRLAGPGILDATLEGPASRGAAAVERRPATIALALISAPSAHRRPLAFARLAHALGAHVVPSTIERHLGAGEVVALLEGQPVLLGKLRGKLAVENDGTLVALLSAPRPASEGEAWDTAAVTALHPTSALLVKRWEGWAGAPVAAPGERARLVRDVVEMLALDYLAGHGTRRALLYVAEREALILEDNREAFPDHVQRALVDPLLRRLRAVARFPRGLRDALARFDRARAEAVLHPGGFEDWLVSPRSLVELDERRAGLLSLIEAQIALRGEAAVLSL